MKISHALKHTVVSSLLILFLLFPITAFAQKNLGERLVKNGLQTVRTNAVKQSTVSLEKNAAWLELTNATGKRFVDKVVPVQPLNRPAVLPGGREDLSSAITQNLSTSIQHASLLRQLDRGAQLAWTQVSRNRSRKIDYQFAKWMNRHYGLAPASPHTSEVLSGLNPRKPGGLEPLLGRLAFLGGNRERVLKSYLNKTGPGSIGGQADRLLYLGKESSLSGEFKHSDWVLLLETSLSPYNQFLPATTLGHWMTGGDMGTSGQIVLSKENSLKIRFNSPDSFAQLDIFYTKLLRCTPQKPCFLRMQEASALLYTPDKQFWLRLGYHEVASVERLHLHLYHIFTDVTQGTGLKLYVNYAIQIERNAYTQLLGTDGAALSDVRSASWLSFQKRYSTLITAPIKKMISQGLVAPY